MIPNPRSATMCQNLTIHILPNRVLAGCLCLLAATVILCAAETATNVNPLTGAAGLPGATAISDIQASGPIHRVAKASYACQLRGHGGADWNDQKIPGDGKGRWMQGICLLGAYFHEKPQKMMDEIPRMLKMRNSLGYFGPEYGPDIIRGGDVFDHNHVVNWGLDYARYFDPQFGMEFTREFTKAAFMVREASLSPGPRQPGSRWVSWGETAADFGALQGLSRLAMVTGNVDYLRFVRSYADVGLGFSYDRGHGHSTMSAMHGYVLAYQATGEKKYLDHAIRVVDTIAMANETTDMGLPDYFGSVAVTEGCAVVDWMIVNLRLGQATGQAKYFDRAERILWGSYMHHLDATGSMGCGSRSVEVLAPGGGSIPWCCDMHGAKGIGYALMHTLLNDDQGLIMGLYYPFTATAKVLKNQDVRLIVTTDYPQNGLLKIRVDDCRATDAWRLRLRIPAWSRVTSVTINGQTQALKQTDGWLDLKRVWQNGDEVGLEIPLPVWFARPNSEEPLSLPVADGEVLRNVRVFRGPLLMSAPQNLNANLNAATFKESKQGPTIKIQWNQVQAPLMLQLSATSAHAPDLKQDGKFQYPLTQIHTSAVVAKRSDQNQFDVPLPLGVSSVDKGLNASSDQDPAKPKSVVLVPIAEAPSKGSPKIVLFDVMGARK